MVSINTVLGPIDTADLGFTLMHEHILSGPPGLSQEYPELFGSDLMGRIVSSLAKARQGGINTIVDATTFDLGRNISMLQEASRRSGINIIACTGWWTNVPHDMSGISADQLASLFIKDCEQGIAATGIKPGILKAGSDKEGVIPVHETVLRAVARAHLKTGLPIMLHSYAPGRVGKRQLAILKEEGVNLNRVKVDHSSDTCDLDYLTWIIDQGAYLGMDRYPGPGSVSVSTDGRIKVLKALIDAGYAIRLLLSHDWILIPILAEVFQFPFMKEILDQNPYEFLFINKVVLPRLREMGIPDTTVNHLCVDGPRRFFEGDDTKIGK